MFTRKVVLFVVVSLAWLNLSLVVMAQAVSGTLLGTVSDPSSATVAGAKVTAVQAETGAVRDTVTNESGNYSMPDLPPGPIRSTSWLRGSKRRYAKTSLF